MSANIRTYVGRQAAWHKAGKVTGQYQTWKELVEHGLNYPVEKMQLVHPLTGKPVDSYGTFRMDTNEFLANVGKDYPVVHHSMGFEMVDKLIGSIDGAHYETAGCLGVGEKVWGLADLALTIRVGDDETKGYLAFMTGYDGKTAHRYKKVMTRIVCQNTWNMALAEKTNAQFVVQHRGNALAKVEQAHVALDQLRGEYQSVEEQLNFLASRKVTRESYESIMDQLFPKKELNKNGEPVNQSRREKALYDLTSIFADNDGNTFPEQKGTAYNLFNAFTNYIDHVKGNDQSRAESAMFGNGEKAKMEALEVITLAANDMPMKPVARQFVPVPVTLPAAGSMLDAIVEAGAIAPAM